MQLFEQAQAAITTTRAVVEEMAAGLAAQVVDPEKKRLSRGKLDHIQPAAFSFAGALAAVEAAEATLHYAERIGQSYERDLACVFAANVTKEIAQMLQFDAATFGVDNKVNEALAAHAPFITKALSTEELMRIGAVLIERNNEHSGSYGIDEDHELIRETFAQFADSQLAPHAEHIHRHDDIIPEDLLASYAEMGVFGISIPEEYGGSYIDNLSMVLATEELSRVSLGAGGSVITRPEICAKALLKGGSPAQKQEWLPKIATGETFVSVAVTEPNAGSDVASLRVTAKKTEGGYLLNGEKTWCTFAGRANVFILLARTGSVEDGHKGLTLFLVEKPAKISTDDHHSFTYEQPEGGRCEGHAIPTLGYRGMHSFSVMFEDYFIPEHNRVGEEGKGFALQMEGFAGGRIQTAARAVGVMEACLRTALSYTQERHVFGRSLYSYPLSTTRIVQMAAKIMACRQLTYHVCGLMDEGKGSMEASLIKLLSCREAETVAREAMQMHGGMGYSEEYAISRYWVDARVLSIFEGAEEVLALYVVTRQKLREHIAKAGEQ